MSNPGKIYELLLDYAADDRTVDEIIVGLVWTCCRSGNAVGLAMTPDVRSRTLTWCGTLKGRSLAELAGWVREWEPHKASVGMAAINAALNRRKLPLGTILEPRRDAGNLAVFDHFLPQLKDKKVVVVGRYPGLEGLQVEAEITVLERQPAAGDLPDPAAEFLLPKADWVFLTASSIPNKTFPRLAELAQGATTVLMGPTVPWLPQLHEFGIDYLAGVEVVDASCLLQTAAEGGGVRIFEEGVRYRVVELSPKPSMEWLRREISATFAEKEAYKEAMERWYATGRTERFPDYARLEAANVRLSRLDSAFKALWDDHHGTADAWAERHPSTNTEPTPHL